MKHCLLAASVVALALAPLEPPMTTRAIVIVDAQCRTHVWMLPADWRPKVSNGTLTLAGHGRISVSDVLLVRPKVAEDAAGRNPMRIVFSCPSTRELPQTIWLPKHTTTLDHYPPHDGFHIVDELTWVRAGAYHIKE